MHYKIITAVYNAGRFFDRYVESIRWQDHEHYDVCIVDDFSTDGTAERVKEACERNGWNYILQTENRGAVHNQVSAIRSMDCKPDDVLVFVDGDDRLAHSDVLRRLDYWYSTGAKLTYGQYRPDPESATCTLAAPFPADMIVKRNFREVVRNQGGLYWNHLRTFKHEIFAQMSDWDFRNDFGEWYKTAADAAMMYPALELAAPYIQYVPEVLLVYTSDNTISDWRRWPKQCDRDHNHILTKAVKERFYEPLV